MSSHDFANSSYLYPNTSLEDSSLQKKSLNSLIATLKDVFCHSQVLDDSSLAQPAAQPSCSPDKHPPFHFSGISKGIWVRKAKPHLALGRGWINKHLATNVNCKLPAEWMCRAAQRPLPSGQPWNPQPRPLFFLSFFPT